MQSSQVPSSSSGVIPSAGGGDSSTKPRASQILKSLPEGDKPMDILNAIVNRDSSNENLVNPQEMVDAVKERRDSEKQNTPPSGDTVETHNQPEPIIAKDSATSNQEFIDDDIPLVSTDKSNISENLKKQRIALNETKKSLKAKEEEAEQLRKELEAYEKGEKIPTPLLEKQSRIQELERYEKIHALKTSRGFQEQYIKPLENIKTKLKELGKEYDIPEETMEAAIGIQDKRQLNSFLRDHLDDLDAIEAKKLIQDAKEIITKARDAELEPQKVLEELEVENQKLEIAKKQELVGTLTRKANDAWIKAHSGIVSEGKIIELIPNEKDSEFTENYVKPHLEASAREFGKFVTRISQKLSEPLDDEEMEFLAKMTQLAHASASMAERSKFAESTADKLLKTSKKLNGLYRPPVGEAHAGGGGVVPQRETREDRIQGLLQAGRQFARGR